MDDETKFMAVLIGGMVAAILALSVPFLIFNAQTRECQERLVANGAQVWAAKEACQ